MVRRRSLISSGRGSAQSSTSPANGGCGSMAPPTSFLPRRRSRLRLSPPPRAIRHRRRIGSRRHHRQRRHPTSPRPRLDQARCHRRPCRCRCRCHAGAPAAGPRSDQDAGVVCFLGRCRYGHHRGRVVVRAGKVLGLDEAGIIAKGRAATTKLWNEAKRLGHFPPEAEPATAD